MRIQSLWKHQSHFTGSKGIFKYLQDDVEVLLRPTWSSGSYQRYRIFDFELALRSRVWKYSNCLKVRQILRFRNFLGCWIGEYSRLIEDTQRNLSILEFSISKLLKKRFRFVPIVRHLQFTQTLFEVLIGLNTYEFRNRKFIEFHLHTACNLRLIFLQLRFCAKHSHIIDKCNND